MTYWDISTAFYSGKSRSIGWLVSIGRSIRFKPDGLIMYLVSGIDTTIYQFTLSIPWDITTAVYSEKYLDVGKQDGSPQDISFNLDGSILYMLGDSNDTVFQYDLTGKKTKNPKPPSPPLSTPWDISSFVYNRIKLDISSLTTHLFGLFFSSDGTIFYTLDPNIDTVYQFTLFIPWDITSGEDSHKFFHHGALFCMSKNIAFSSDGTKLYILYLSPLVVGQYTLSIPWDLSTASYSNKFFYVGEQATYNHGISFSNIGSEMYILCVDTKTVYQYTLPETPPPPPKKEASRTGTYSFKTLS
ncbi:hypothetical protein ES705_51028 [subsurface metagenome]